MCLYIYTVLHVSIIVQHMNRNRLDVQCYMVPSYAYIIFFSNLTVIITGAPAAEKGHKIRTLATVGEPRGMTVTHSTSAMPIPPTLYMRPPAPTPTPSGKLHRVPVTELDISIPTQTQCTNVLHMAGMDKIANPSKI